jgi:hypothetical protein
MWKACWLVVGGQMKIWRNIIALTVMLFSGGFFSLFGQAPTKEDLANNPLSFLSWREKH